MKRPRYAKRVSQRDIRNALAFNAGSTEMEVAVKRGPQAEGLTNKAIAKWAPLHKELVLGRNKRRLATPPGMSAPIMLGWLVAHSPDWIGYRSVVITPSMLGKRIAQFVGLESKSKDGVVSKEQEAFLNNLKDAGGIAAVVRDAADAEEALRG
jgi:hypothetical protein